MIQVIIYTLLTNGTTVLANNITSPHDQVSQFHVFMKLQETLLGSLHNIGGG